MKKIYILLFFTLTLLTSYATIRNVPATYSTIQGALNACVANDTVMVQPGNYFENIIWPAIANIKLLSAGDSTNTIINGNNAGRVLQFSSAAINNNTAVKGFKITGGYLSASLTEGAGVLIDGCSPLLEAVAITDNHVNAANWAHGAGLSLNNSRSVILNSSVTNNSIDSSSWGYGGGVYMEGTGKPQFINVLIKGNYTNSDSWCYGVGVHSEIDSVVFTNCVVNSNFSNDSANWYYGGGMYFTSCNAELYNVHVFSNTMGKEGSWYHGTGIYFDNGKSLLTNVLVESNIMSTGGNWYYGGAIYFRNTDTSATLTMMHVTASGNKKSDGSTINGSGFYADNNTGISITNSVFWNTNSGTEIAGGAPTSVTYSCIRNGFAGAGNISTNPQFISATDFHLASNSPCIAAGTITNSPPDDLDNMTRPMPAATNPDIGCYELNQVVSITDFEKGNSFVIYPNPVVRELFVTGYWLSGNKKIDIEIVDFTGKNIYKAEIFSVESVIKIPVSDLAAGVYFLEIKTPDVMRRMKFVKQ